LAQALSAARLPQPGADKPLFPPVQELFTQPLARYGRFDNYTRLGCAAVALALKEALLYELEQTKNIGLIVSSQYECYETDLNFYATTIEDGGSYASPNLFSYTLPGIVIGECAAYFKLTGPTFCVGEDPRAGLGRSALQAAVSILVMGETDCVIAGWLDYPPELEFLKASTTSFRYGAIFLVLSADTASRQASRALLHFESADAAGLALPDLPGLARAGA
jgi:3-oxoacyl-(acyl-carrier-protein) synthase